MSCSLKSNLLRYSQYDQKQNQQYMAPELPVVVLVFCACMIAMQGSSLGLSALDTAQLKSDSVTERIGITQMHLFNNINQEKYTRG